MRVFFLRLYTRFEVRRPFRSGDMIHFLSEHYVGRVTLTFDLEAGVRMVDNLPTNFGVYGTFHFRLIGQTLSDASRDLATLTFDLLTSK